MQKMRSRSWKHAAVRGKKHSRTVRCFSGNSSITKTDLALDKTPEAWADDNRYHPGRQGCRYVQVLLFY